MWTTLLQEKKQLLKLTNWSQVLYQKIERDVFQFQHGFSQFFTVHKLIFTFKTSLITKIKKEIEWVLIIIIKKGKTMGMGYLLHKLIFTFKNQLDYQNKEINRMGFNNKKRAKLWVWAIYLQLLAILHIIY